MSVEKQIFNCLLFLSWNAVNTFPQVLVHKEKGSTTLCLEIQFDVYYPNTLGAL